MASYIYKTKAFSTVLALRWHSHQFCVIRARGRGGVGCEAPQGDQDQLTQDSGYHAKLIKFYPDEEASLKCFEKGSENEITQERMDLGGW